jgi:hypothetical protein
VASPSGGLAQLEPTGHAEGAGQRPYRVARGTTGPPPAAEAGGRTVAALVDPHAGAPGMKFSLPWRRRPPRGPVPGPADAALRDAAALRGDVATVFVRRHFARLDHRPVDELIARGGAEVVRIVPAGGLVLAARDLSRLGRRFAGTGRTVFVPGPGSRVAARQLDLVVVGPGSHAGSWVLLDGEMPGRGYATTGTGRLARDITTRDIDPGEGELVTWAAELSALPVSLFTQPGDSARSFGLELEFDLGPEVADAEWQKRMRRILADLRRFGLSAQTTIAGSHSTRLQGYTRDPGGWRLEMEPIIPYGGEVIAPILHLQSPDGQRTTWASIALVIAIVRRHGGTGGFRTAGHVHVGVGVGVGDFDRDPGRLGQLLGLVQGHQDALSQPPGDRYHRRVTNVKPLPEPTGGYQAQAREQLNGRDRLWAVSLNPVALRQRQDKAAEGDHAEFRLWGGDLDLGAIQARVRLSLALTDTAARGGQLPARQPLGQHYRHASAADSAAALGRLLSLLPGAAALVRAQVMHLWQLSQWQPPLVPGIRGHGNLLWAGAVQDGPAWEGYSHAAAAYGAPVIILLPHGTERELASPPPDGPLPGWDPAAIKVTGEQQVTLRRQVETLRPRAGSRPVIIALHPAGTDDFARQGAWVVLPVRAEGRFRVTLRDGPPQQAGWHSEHGWELISPDGASRVLPGTVLDRAAVQDALAIARDLPETAPQGPAPHDREQGSGIGV